MVVGPVAMSGRAVGAWGRTIATLYMGWYTVFVVANVLVLGWVCRRDAKDSAALRNVSSLCVLLTLGSTAMVGYTLRAVAPEPFGTLIVFAAVANGVGLLGVMWAWWKLMRRV
jgi:uncharacterized membrane protein YjjB (DUF3815 family)